MRPASRPRSEAGGLRAREDLRAATRLALAGWKPNLGYGVLVAVLGAVVLGPAISWLLVKGMELAAGGTVLNYDIASFVLSPAGVLAFLLWSLLVAGMAVIAQAGHVYVAAARARDRDVRLPGVLRRVGSDLGRVPGLGAVALALLAVLLTPLIAAAVGAAGGLLLAPFRGTRLLDVLPSGRLLVLALAAGAALLALGFWLYVRWSLTLPLFCLEGGRLGKAVRESGRRLRGHFYPVARAHLLHHATWGLLVAVVSLVLGTVLRPLVKGALERDPAGALWVLAAVLALVTGVFALLTIFGVARLVALEVVHHDKLGGKVDVARLLRPLDPSSPAARRRRWGLVLAALAALTAGTFLTLPQVREELSRIASPPTVTAHRGSSLGAPQNTLAAVRLAIEEGADACEIDVQQARDGALVVVHDVNLKDLAARDVDVYDLTGTELVAIDVGSHGEFAPRFAGETIPTLAQVLDLARGRIDMNVELKVHGRETPEFVADVVALLRDRDMLEHAWITSLDPGILREVRRLEPDLRIGMIVSMKVGSASQIDCDFYSTQPLIASTSFIRRAHAEGREVHVWTLNDPAEMTRFADRGADSIITDVPAVAKALFARRTEADEWGAAVRRLFE